MPHLRRVTSDRVDLLSVQFFSSGGSFVVEVAVCPHEGFTTHWGKHIEPKKVRAIDLHPDVRWASPAPVRPWAPL